MAKPSKKKQGQKQAPKVSPSAPAPAASVPEPPAELAPSTAVRTPAPLKVSLPSLEQISAEVPAAVVPPPRALELPLSTREEAQAEARALLESLSSVAPAPAPMVEEVAAPPVAPPVVPPAPPLAATVRRTPVASPSLVLPALGPLRSDKTSQTFLYFVGMVAALVLVSKLSGADSLDLVSTLWSKNLGPREAAPDGEEMVAAPVLGGPTKVAGPAGPSDSNEEPPLPPPVIPGQGDTPFTGQPIEEGCREKKGEVCVLSAMDPFYAKLAKVLRKEPGAVARVSHFGDSILASDYVSSRARERLQDTFGDAGHGFLFIGQPSRWYYQEDVQRDSSSGWDARGISSDKKAKDGLYGLGGATFEAQGPGHKASFSTAKEDPKDAKGFGTKVSRFDLYYLAQPDGGSLTVSIDGTEVETLSTQGPAVTSQVKGFPVPDGPHALQLKTAGGKVRAFGVVMEREAPGVVYDSMGLVSSSTRALLSINEAHWVEQLKLRNPDLVILMYGTNEANYTSSSDKGIAEYEQGVQALLRRVRVALPGSSCLMIAPPDTDEEKGGAMVTKAVVPRLVEAQRRAALAEGCAYWDTFTWMGGKNSMAAWVKKGLGQSDYAHPTKKGAAKIGDAFVDAILAGYGAYAARAAAPR